MTGRFRLPPFSLAILLLALMTLLATLQYRWLGQVSEAERDRMRATLGSGAASFSQDFDGELTRAYLLFQTDPLAEPEEPTTRFATRYDRWHATSRFPRLIKEFYTYTPDAPGGRPQRFDPATRTFVAADWPPEMSGWQERFPSENPPDAARRSGPNNYFIRRISSAIWESAPALVVPSPVVLLTTGRPPANMPSMPRFSYSILLIDRDYVAHDMLPALAEQYFLKTGASDYQVAVVSRGKPAGVIYHSSPSFNPAPDSPADATADLFSVRTQDFGRLAAEVHRYASFATTMQVQTTQVMEKGGGRRGRANQPVSILVQAAPGSSAPLPTATSRVALVTTPAWQLVLKHQSGSLEAAVNAVRRRNLIVSSSILGVLAASMGLLVLSTRRAQQLARQQMEFVATVTHELRTPLAVIRSAADNLADGVIHDDPQIRKYGELMRNEGRRLTDTVEQILEFAGIQSGQRTLTPVPVPLAPLVHDILQSTATLIEQEEIQVDVTIPADLPAMLGDENALRRVLQNLIGNAVKYGASGRWIGIDAGTQGADVLITVSDRGAGIDPAEQQRIFEPFYRARAAVDAQIQGAGLGLSLVRRIVEAHGGRVSVRSTPGQGAAFSVQVPAASDPRESESASAARRSSGAEAPRFS